jgi:hypothetical protein
VKVAAIKATANAAAMKRIWRGSWLEIFAMASSSLFNTSISVGEIGGAGKSCAAGGCNQVAIVS